MFVKLSKSGQVVDYCTKFLVFFALEEQEILGYHLLGENKSAVFQRYLTINLNKKESSFVSKSLIKNINVWVEWSTCITNTDHIIAIGNDISCKVRFEPIVQKQNNLLRRKVQKLTDGLTYALNIQSALLPNLNNLPDTINHFVIYEPKDIVSGDFYMTFNQGTEVIIISIDCTGHGVPGALMTVLVNSILNDIIRVRKIKNPETILGMLDLELQQKLHENGGKTIPDGLDIGICQVNTKNGKLIFSGAYQNLLVVKNESVTKLKGGRFPIGYFSDFPKQMTTQTYQLSVGDRFYLGSDGYADQFGGERNKKIGNKRLVQLLQESFSRSLLEQKEYLMNFLNDWKGNEEQVDDILLFGFEIVSLS